MTLNELRDQIDVQGEFECRLYNYKTDTYMLLEEKQCANKEIHYMYPGDDNIVIEFDYEEE